MRIRRRCRRPLSFPQGFIDVRHYPTRDSDGSLGQLRYRAKTKPVSREARLMRRHSVYEICSRATAIISTLLLVHACATSPVDHQAEAATTQDESKMVGFANYPNEKYDALTSATPRKSDDSKANGDASGASVGWILLVVLGLIAAARRQRFGKATKPLEINATVACQPVSDHEFR